MVPMKESRKSLEKLTDLELRQKRSEVYRRGAMVEMRSNSFRTFLRIARSKGFAVPKKERDKARKLYEEAAKEQRKEKSLESMISRVLNKRYKVLYHACPHCGYKHNGPPKLKKAKLRRKGGKKKK